MTLKRHQHVPTVRAPVQLQEHLAGSPMQQKPVAPADDHVHHTQYRKSIRHAQQREFSLARVVAHGIDHHELRHRALRFLLVELAKAGLSTEAEQVLALMTDEAVRASSKDALHAMRPKHHS